MNPFIGMNMAASCLILVAFVLCAGGQVVHGYYRSAYSAPASRPLVIAYESALLVHLVIMSLIAFAGVQGHQELHLNLPGLAVPLQPFLWFNAAVVAIAASAAIASIDEDSGVSEIPAWMPLFEAAMACACLPGSMEMAGAAWVYVMMADALYFLFRTTYQLLVDTRMRSHVVSQLSVIEALKAMPEGMLYADEEGRTLLANDAMRHCLSALGLPTDFARVDELWMLLCEKASGDHAVETLQGMQREGAPWLFLRIGPQEVRLFSFEGSGFDSELSYPSPRALDENPAYLYTAKRLLGSQPDMRIFAYDVTQEVAMLQAIERTNAELAMQYDELQASMETVREAAENEAMLRMRGRVHDVIGQRLSMLHRALEDDAVSDEELEKLLPLLNGILDDLAAEVAASPDEELAATVDAFKLSGVIVNVQGELPQDPELAKVFADCVREATTNAVKHARSTKVDVRISPTEVSISNDGQLPSLPIREGTGLKNMRRAAASVGATLTLEAMEQPFTVRLAV